MNEEKIKQLFQLADTELYKARNELNRPAFDVVKYAVCVFARSALYHFLNCLYILHSQENNDPIEESKTLEQFIHYCKKFNKEIESMDFFSVHCMSRDVLNNDDEFFFCNDLNQVKTCADLAENIKELVIQKAWGGIIPDK